MLKIYELTNNCISLRTMVSLNGKPISLEFRGGARSGNYKIAGRYSTIDESMQNAIESSKAYGVDFKLAYEESLTETVKEEVKKEEVVEEENTDPILLVKTLKAAKEYLMANVEGLTLDQLKNKDAVLEVASSNNINFPNL
jgi:hypothetical protein